MAFEDALDDLKKVGFHNPRRLHGAVVEVFENLEGGGGGGLNVPLGGAGEGTITAPSYDEGHLALGNVYIQDLTLAGDAPSRLSSGLVLGNTVLGDAAIPDGQGGYLHNICFEGPVTIVAGTWQAIGCNFGMVTVQGGELLAATSSFASLVEVADGASAILAACVFRYEPYGDGTITIEAGTFGSGGA